MSEKNDAEERPTRRDDEVHPKVTNSQMKGLIRQDSTESLDGNECPVCLGPTTLKVTTRCNHSFCGECLMEVGKRLTFLSGGMSCPLCRQPVTHIDANFSEEEMANAKPEITSKRDELLTDVKYFNFRFSDQPFESWMDYFRMIGIEARVLYTLTLFNGMWVAAYTIVFLFLLSAIASAMAEAYPDEPFYDNVLNILLPIIAPCTCILLTIGLHHAVKYATDNLWPD